MVSLLLQKQHFSSPFQFHFKKLSFVKITPFIKNQTKILTFRGTLSFQRALFRGIAIWFTILLYIDWTVNTPLLVRVNLIESTCSSSCTKATLVTNPFHLSSLSPTSVLRKEILRGVVLKTLAIVICFFLVMLYKDGYCDLRVKFPNHLFFQNLTWAPLWMLKMDNSRN